MNIARDQKLVRQPSAKYVIGSIGHTTLQREFVIVQIENGDFPGTAVNRSKVDSGDQEQSVALVKLRELRVLPVELFHIVAMPFGHRVARIPNLQREREANFIHLA